MNPEDFDRFLDKIFGEWDWEATQSPLIACFPEAVIERFRTPQFLPRHFSSNTLNDSKLRPN
jgi:hypothetical protein